MAGHNKWSKIKRDKAINDAKKGALFTKLGNQIALAAREGVDPQTNPALALIMETAKSFNMPLATIDRAIKRAADKATASLEEVLYEGYGPGGVAILIEAATDNRKRTYPQVKAVFNKSGGRIADGGSVSFMFERLGQIGLEISDDEVVLAVLEAGAIDAIEDSGQLIAQTKLADLHQVRQKLVAAGHQIAWASPSYVSKTTIEPPADQLKKSLKLIENLEDLDDVVSVYDNINPGSNEGQ